MEQVFEVSVKGVVLDKGEIFPSEADTVYLMFQEKEKEQLIYLKMHVTDSMALLKSLLDLSAQKGFDYLWKGL